MRFLVFLFSFCLSLVGFKTLAQCPVAASCTPGAAPSSAHAFGMGIFNVTVGSGVNGFSNSTSGVTDGYQDYSCTKKANLLEGVSTTISITTNPNVNENVRVWLDLNNDGVFNATSELVFFSVNAKTHTGSISIPVSAAVIKNTVLRLRVSADNFTSPLPTPCSTPAYSQVEDYGITVVPNTQKPVVNFSVNNPITCSPTVQFTNLVQNGATSYLWDFGDGTTSTSANPSKTFAAPGTFTVKLKACNANGCDSLTKTNYVTYHTNVPVAASCAPATTSYCCGYGITNFSFHSLTNSSVDGAAGYEDFTCTKSVTVQENATYPVAVTAATSNLQDFWVYIDYNNDGSFSASELIFTKLSTLNPSGNVVIQGGAVLNTPLRMRVVSDATGNLSGPCTSRINGQVEDYAITIVPNTMKPVAVSTSNQITACDTLIQFTDLSQNVPTSWSWDFGDGSLKSTAKNPVHNYAASGVYTIKLKACNAIGCDSVSSNLIVSKPCLPYCLPINRSNPNPITNVTFGNINNSTGGEPGTYGNYTRLFTSVVKGNTYPISVALTTYPGYLINVFVDFNQDGDFQDKGEFVASGLTPTIFTGTFQIPTTAKTGVTRMRIMHTGQDGNPCRYGTLSVESEDYSLNILPNNQPPTSLFFTTGRNSCSYTVTFNDTSANTPTSWLWNFGNPTTGSNNFSFLQNPSHVFSGPGTYSISLTTTNNFGNNTLTKSAYVTVTGNTGPRSARCIQTTKTTGPTYFVGISRVSLNTINHTTVLHDRYQDYSCSQQTTLIQGQNNPITVETGSATIENVRVWIDYNDDGYFNPAMETAFASDGKYSHTGNIIPPANAVTNKVLRMRVADERSSQLAPTPCNTIEGGQAEDYGVTIVQVTGITNHEFTRQLKLYPNPNTGTFSLEIPTVLKGTYQLEVQNMVGQTVAKQALKVANAKSHQLDLEFLPKGVYLLRLYNEEKAAVKKLIIE